MRDADAVEIIQSLSGLTKRQLQVDMKGQAQGHDIGIVPGEAQGGHVLRKGGKIHPEEVDFELPVDVMELVSVLLQRMLFIDFTQVLLIVGAFIVDALMDPEAGTFLDWNEGVTAVRAFVLHRFCVDAAIDESGAADLALILTLAAVVVIEVIVRSTADRTDFVCGDRTAVAAPDRLDPLAIPMFVVSNEEAPVLLMVLDDQRELVDLKLLVLR